jgi:hypothetical protein
VPVPRHGWLDALCVPVGLVDTAGDGGEPAGQFVVQRAVDDVGILVQQHGRPDAEPEGIGVTALARQLCPHGFALLGELLRRTPYEWAHRAKAVAVAGRQIDDAGFAAQAPQLGAVGLGGADPRVGQRGVVSFERDGAVGRHQFAEDDVFEPIDALRAFPAKWLGLIDFSRADLHDRAAAGDGGGTNRAMPQKPRKKRATQAKPR